MDEEREQMVRLHGATWLQLRVVILMKFFFAAGGIGGPVWVSAQAGTRRTSSALVPTLRGNPTRGDGEETVEDTGRTRDSDRDAC